MEAATRALLARLEGARRTVATARLDAGELEGLPPPVQRYLRIALAEGQPLLTAVNCEHLGTFSVGETTTDQWKSFRSSQRVITQRPGFVWDATVAMAPVCHCTYTMRMWQVRAFCGLRYSGWSI